MNKVITVLVSIVSGLALASPKAAPVLCLDAHKAFAGSAPQDAQISSKSNALSEGRITTAVTAGGAVSLLTIPPSDVQRLGKLPLRKLDVTCVNSRGESHEAYLMIEGRSE